MTDLTPFPCTKIINATAPISAGPVHTCDRRAMYSYIGFNGRREVFRCEQHRLRDESEEKLP